MSDKLSVVVIDDHPLFRQAVIQTLSQDSVLSVVGEGASYAEALRLVADLLPDLLLLDIGIPGGGLEVVRQLALDHPFTKVVMLTASESEDDVLDALRAGACGYVLKGVSGNALVQITRAVAAGESYITPSLAATVLFEDRRQTQEENTLQSLTPREKEILEMVASGRANKEIAYELHLSEKTVKHYMTNILQKLQVRNRVEATLVAQRGRQRSRR